MASKRIGRKAVYPGSFDPVTYGHLALIRKAAKMFDFLYVAVGTNPTKRLTFTSEERIDMIERAVKGLRNVEVASFEGLVVDYAVAKKANIVIRGLRAVSDYEAELQMALTNRRLNPEIETVFLVPSEEYFYISSGLIKEIAQLGGRINNFVPAHVERMVQKALAIA